MLKLSGSYYTGSEVLMALIKLLISEVGLDVLNVRHQLLTVICS